MTNEPEPRYLTAAMSSDDGNSEIVQIGHINSELGICESYIMMLMPKNVL